MTKLSNDEVDVLAGVFACSNCGMNRPSRKDVRYALKYGFTVHQSVMHFCGQYMESDDHEDMFLEEAYSWVHYLKNTSKEDLIRAHSEIMALI